MSDEPRVAGGAAVVAAALSLALYVATCAPGVLWGDSATFQVRIARGELESPLGLALTHPLYILLARAWSVLPIGDVAYRVNLFSAVCAAAAAGLVFLFVSRVTGSRFGAGIAAAVLAVSHTFWMHAVMAEVYSLYGLGLAAELCLLERFLSTQRRGWLYGLALVNGLGVCNHLLALLHLPAYGVLLVWMLARGRIRVVHAGLAAVFWLSGASLYISMIVGHAMARGAVGEVVREALTGRGYAARMGGAEFPFVQQAVRTLQAFALNFPTPIVLLALAGAAWLRREALNALFAFMALLFATAFVFGFVYRVPDQYVFFFPCYVLIAAAIGIGAAGWASTAGRRWALVVLAVLPGVVYEAAPGILRRTDVELQGKRLLRGRDEYAYFLRPRKKGENSAAAFCAAALQTAGPGGYLLADSTIKSPLVFVRDVVGVGRDVVLESGGAVMPAPPTLPKSEAVLQRFARRGRAFVCDATPGYVDWWIVDQFELEPVDGIFRLRTREGGTGRP